MRLIKMLGLVAIAASAAMAFMGASSAMATSSLLCLNDSVLNPTAAECNEPSAVHFLSVKVVSGVTSHEKVTLLNNILNIKCEVLIAGEVLKGLKTNAPAVIHVAKAGLVYTNCTFGCTIETLQGGLINLLKISAELAEVSSEGFIIRKVCFGFFDCDYDSTGLVGHYLGPLEANTGGKGHMTYTEQPVNLLNNLSGGCPAVTKLDALLQSLVPLYVRG